jgi:hypothetical protein
LIILLCLQTKKIILPSPDFCSYQIMHFRVEDAFNNPDMNCKQILQLYGLKQAVNVIDMRELRAMFAKTHDRSWYRLMKDVNKVKLPQGKDSFKVIREQLVKFEALKSL